MGKFMLSQRSITNLKGVHDDLVRLVYTTLSLTKYDFVIIEGLRSLERQTKMVETGMSQTMDSKHLIGKAVDFMVLINNLGSWDTKYYKQVSDAFKQASKNLNIPIIWGGDWKTFKDYDHIELDTKVYK